MSLPNWDIKVISADTQGELETVANSLSSQGWEPVSLSIAFNTSKGPFFFMALKRERK